MSEWFERTAEGATFRFGRRDPEAARAAICGTYRRDDEDETVDETVSCYNCRYRRWTAQSFTCMRPGRNET